MKRNLRILLLLPIIASLASCNNDSSSLPPSSSAPSSSTSSSGQAEYVDYIHDSNVKLTLAYEGKSFVKDGIQKVTLDTCIDGDTAHFDAGSDGKIKARYYGIDTPESTGKVQPFGRGASNFNKEKLEAANENGTIVITGVHLDEYVPPEFDSTGSRYVTLIWINTEKKDAKPEELVLLNLWIVQEGWSNVKNVLDLPDFADTFYAAEKQAQALKLNLFSGEDDPLFNYGDYEDASLLDIKKEIVASIQDPEHKNAYDNKKVRIVGTVAGYSNSILYIQNYDADADEYAGINFYVGMGEPSTAFKTVGTYIECCGLGVDSDTFGFQLTDGNFNILSTAENVAKVLIPADENVDEFALHTFEFKPGELKEANFEILNCSVELTEEVTVVGGYTNTDNNETTLYVEDSAGNELDYDIFVPFIYRPDPNNFRLKYDDYTDYVGQKFLIKGVYTYHRFSSGRIGYQINPSNSNDIVLVEEEA